MRTHGWSGNPPADDDEARRRIVEATMRCVDRLGPQKAGLADVAADLGVTRQTVYRYFPSTEDLMKATAVEAADEFLDRLARHVSGLEDPGDILVEAFCFAVELLPHESYVGLLLASGRRDEFVLGTTSPTARQFGEALLRRLAIDWAAAGIDGERMDELVEFMLRLLQSFVLDPGDPPRTGAGLRSFVRLWLPPALDGLTAAPAGAAHRTARRP